MHPLSSRPIQPRNEPGPRLTAAVLALVFTCLMPWVAIAQTPSPEPSTSESRPRGIDVSHTQGEIDWSKVAATGVSFVFIKASEGDDWQDPLFEKNWSGAKEAGLLRGAYHFFRPDDAGATQAANFLASVSLVSGDLPPVLDVEVSGSVASEQIVTEVRAWLEKVKSESGLTPILYTDPTFWRSLDTSAFSDYPLWIADYDVDRPTVPDGWPAWTFWQHSSTGSVSGVEGSVDLDVFNGSTQALSRLTLP
jgi:lysozyme